MRIEYLRQNKPDLITNKLNKSKTTKTCLYF